MTPYISIVAASRNDNHGENMGKRMRMFVNGLIAQANKFKLPMELIIVEWNPPAGNAPLSDVLPQPKARDFLSLRYIVVPNEIHQQYRFADKLPLYQMIAKNVGIRRAKADFVLCTNVDVLFSNELMQQLAQKNLDKNSFYRANRCDIPAALDESWSVEKQLEFGSQNIIRRLGFDHELMNMGKVPEWVYNYRWFAKIINRYNAIRRKRYFTPLELEFYSLDTKACGDFTMMHKDAWLKIQGYLELDLYSIHIDSMAVIVAKASGLTQTIFPPNACIYHIDHYNGWESMTALEKVNFINQKPGIGWDIVSETAMQLLKDRTGYNFNKKGWGFADSTFEEVVFNDLE